MRLFPPGFSGGTVACEDEEARSRGYGRPRAISSRSSTWQAFAKRARFACDCDGAVWQGTNMAEITGETRGRYPHFLAIPTRWIDNDIYGHVNNVRYYEFFDTVINRYLIEVGGLDIHNGDVIGIAVETTCSFHRSLAFPDIVNAGLRVGKLGTSSVRYEIGLFRGDDAECAATGHFVHVFVTRATQRPTPIPERIRAALEKLQLE
jgi:acyl-CoA thioester hydrolase